jgi:hypothetical protein
MHVLCVLPVALVVIFWARSYLPGELRVMSESGRLFLFFTDADATGYIFPPNGTAPGAARAWNALEIAPRQAEVWRLEALGVRIVGHDTRSAFGFVLISIPYPYVLLLALPPLWWLHRYRRRRAGADGAACDRCGYDLTGNVSGVCPEVRPAFPSVTVTSWMLTVGGGRSSGGTTNVL